MAVGITPNPNVVGPTGPTGPTGSTGAAGATGASGTNLAGFNAQTGTTYTLVIGDKDKIVTASNAAAITVTVVAVSTVNAADGHDFVHCGLEVCDDGCELCFHLVSPRDLLGQLCQVRCQQLVLVLQQLESFQ